MYGFYMQTCIQNNFHKYINLIYPNELIFRIVEVKS